MKKCKLQIPLTERALVLERKQPVARPANGELEKILGRPKIFRDGAKGYVRLVRNESAWPTWRVEIQGKSRNYGGIADATAHG